MKEPPQRSDSVRFRQTDLEAAIDDSGAYGANVASSALPSFLLQLLAPFFKQKSPRPARRRFRISEPHRPELFLSFIISSTKRVKKKSLLPSLISTRKNCWVSNSLQ